MDIALAKHIVLQHCDLQCISLWLNNTNVFRYIYPHRYKDMLCCQSYVPSLVPRPSPSFLSFAAWLSESDGKLGEGLGTRLNPNASVHYSHRYKLTCCAVNPTCIFSFDSYFMRSALAWTSSTKGNWQKTMTPDWKENKCRSF